MATRTRSTHALRHRLRAFRRRPGNARLKGLLLALREGTDTRALGHAWPQHGHDGAVVNLGTRTEESTREHNVARQLYGEGAITEGEVVPRDEYIKRALVAEAETELDVLWREEILDSVAAGARSRMIARDATTVTPMDAKKGTVPIPEHLPFADTTAEAASSPTGTEPRSVDYVNVDYDCEKHEIGLGVTDELADQSQPDAIETTIRLAGQAVEQAINRQHVTFCVDNAAQDQTVGANEANVQDVLEAAENVKDNDFDPANVAALHPELVTELADDPALGYLDFERDDPPADRELQAGDEQPTAGRSVGPALYEHSDATYNGLSGENLNTSNTWGWEASGEIGGFVYGRPFVHTILYRDIDVAEWSPPFTAIRDLQGVTVSAWTDTVAAGDDGSGNKNSISTITQ